MSIYASVYTYEDGAGVPRLGTIVRRIYGQGHGVTCHMARVDGSGEDVISGSRTQRLVCRYQLHRNKNEAPKGHTTWPFTVKRRVAGSYDWFGNAHSAAQAMEQIVTHERAVHGGAEV